VKPFDSAQRIGEQRDLLVGERLAGIEPEMRLGVLVEGERDEDGVEDADGAIMTFLESRSEPICR
jgi:hypothetical protein